MGWSVDRQPHRPSRLAAVESSDVVQFTRPRPSTESGGATAIDLVYQAAEVLQGIEDRAAEATERAHELARRATEQLNLAISRVHGSEMKHQAAEEALHKAHARVDECEQNARVIDAQIAAIQDRLLAAEQRARNAEARAIEAEKTLIQVEDAIRNQLLAKRQASPNRSAAAA